MTVSPLPGNVRFRAYQMGPESAFVTPVTATRRYPGKFMPTVDPHWTDPDIDTGTLGHAVPPYRTAIDVTGQYSGPLAYDDIPTFMTAIYKPVTPSPAGAAITWLCLPAETSQDQFQTWTGEWGDEVTGDQFQYYSGILEKLQLTYPDDLSPIQVQADWRFAQAIYPKTMTAGLSVDSAPIWAYGADTTISLNSTAATIGNTPVLKTAHSMTVTITQAIDVKRFMDGASTRFQAQGYGRGLRTVETSFKLAKSAAALTEAANWLNTNPVERFLSLKTVSPTLIPTTAVPYTSELRFAGYWYTRSEDTHGNANTAMTLVCRSTYDPTLTYNSWWNAICARAAL